MTSAGSKFKACKQARAAACSLDRLFFSLFDKTTLDYEFKGAKTFLKITNNDQRIVCLPRRRLKKKAYQLVLSDKGEVCYVELYKHTHVEQSLAEYASDKVFEGES